MSGKNRQSESKAREELLSGLPLRAEVATPMETEDGWERASHSDRLGAGPSRVSVPYEPDLGMTIRRLRESRQFSLKEVAARSGLTQSFLSQVERNLTSPSVASLRKVAQAFGVPLTELFQGPARPENRVVRRAERRQLIPPGRHWRDYLLTPTLTGKRPRL